MTEPVPAAVPPAAAPPAPSPPRPLDAADRPRADGAPADAPRSRRDALRTALGGALAAGSLAARPDSAPPPQLPFTKTIEDRALLALVHRATQGFTVEEWAEARALGYEGYLEKQLAFELIDDSALAPRLASFSSLNMSAFDLAVNFGTDEKLSVPVFELKQAAFLRAIYSKRQLFERMVELWTDHFNVQHQDGPVIFFKTVDDREVIRANALGSFPVMLAASMRSGAMLHYLDNYANVAGTAQENYARELLELHTVGVDGGYTEADVKAVARCLTGWTYHAGGYSYGEFRFDGGAHDEGPKTVLGTPIPPGGGMADGNVVWGLLVDHPGTAHFLARKLASWLLVHEPPPSVVRRVARAYLETGGDVRAMVRAALSRPSMVEAAPWDHPKLRRPFHFATSLARAVGVDVSFALIVTYDLFALGQAPFEWPAPNGYPDTVGAWGSSLLPRWRHASALLDNAFLGATVNEASLLQRMGDPPPSEYAEAIDQLLTGGTLAPRDKQAVQGFVSSFRAPNGQVLREAIALAASSPSYQLY